jgi:branched-subunit amino acid transport protein
MTSLATWEIWLVMGMASVGTLALRYSFIGLLKRRADEIPESARRALRLIPAAVMAALVAPNLTHPQTAFDPFNERMVAGLVAALVAWRTKNVLATISAGMAGLWVLQALT